MSMPPVGPLPSVFVRPATSEDVGFLTDVVLVATRAQGRLSDGGEEAAYRSGLEHDTDEQVRGLVPDSQTSVIMIDGERAGRWRVVRGAGHIELCGLQLLPAHQGRGVGTHLIQQFVAESRHQGKAARLMVERDNPRARSLIERLGFAVVGERDDGLLMEAPAPR